MGTNPGYLLKYFLLYLENSDSVGVEIGVWALDASRYNFISTTSGKLRRNEINSA